MEFSFPRGSMVGSSEIGNLWMLSLGMSNVQLVVPDIFSCAVSHKEAKSP